MRYGNPRPLGVVMFIQVCLKLNGIMEWLYKGENNHKQRINIPIFPVRLHKPGGGQQSRVFYFFSPLASSF